MNIQYCSDLHLEIFRINTIEDIHPEQYLTPGKAPYLVLCGDICSPKKKAFRLFLEWCSQNWKKVFFVAGNAEYFFDNTYTQPLLPSMRNNLMKDILSKFENVYFMDRLSMDINENTRLLGSTLWTDLSNNNINLPDFPLNDQNQIYIYQYKEYINDICQMHAFEKEWLSKEIDKAKSENKKCIVFTHHLPSFDLLPEKYIGLPMNFCVASESDSLLRDPVIAWIAGNVHTAVVKKINGVDFRINPFGFTKENIGMRNTEAILSIEN
jgi:hypothetical protein